jgi:hypothetical protein
MMEAGNFDMGYDTAINCEAHFLSLISKREVY